MELLHAPDLNFEAGGAVFTAFSETCFFEFRDGLLGVAFEVSFAFRTGEGEPEALRTGEPFFDFGEGLSPILRFFLDGPPIAVV